MSTVDKLFGSSEFVRLLRLFLLNPDRTYEAKEIADRANIKKTVLNTELKTLQEIKLIKKKNFTITEEVKSRSKSTRPHRASKPRLKTRRTIGFTLNQDFELLAALRNLVFNTEPLKDKELAKRFKSVGKIKLIVVAGVFIYDPDSRADLLIVGDKLNKNKLERAINTIESEVGKELEYSVLETPDFKYRLDVYDKFVRDILDYPHRVIIDKIGL